MTFLTPTTYFGKNAPCASFLFKMKNDSSRIHERCSVCSERCSIDILGAKLRSFSVVLSAIRSRLLTFSHKSIIIASGATNSTSGLPHRYSGYFCAHFLGRLPMAGGRVIKRKLNNRACLVRFVPPAAKVGLQSSPSGVVQRQQEGLTMTAISLSNSPIVSENAGRITTTSRDVSAYFGRQHKNVLRAIDNLECSEKFRRLNFEHTPYIDEQNGQTYNQYEMTKDGFVFLAFSFTGKKAAQLKEAYINRFNEMEQIIAKKQRPSIEARKPINDPQFLKLVEAHSENKKLQDEITYLKNWMRSYHVWIDKLIMEGRRV